MVNYRVSAGNVGFCGDPSSKQCKRDQGQQQDNKNRSMVSLYFVIMLGSGTGFSRVVGTLTEELRSNVETIYSNMWRP